MIHHVDHYAGSLCGVAHQLETRVPEKLLPHAHRLFVIIDLPGKRHGLTGPVRTETSRLDDRQPDTQRSDLFCETFRETCQPELRRLVNSQTRRTQPPAQRTDLQDMP